jgi:putative zinc finger/helix-turn-helix YgiT family protein
MASTRNNFPPACPDCDGIDFAMSVGESAFMYGDGGSAVKLTASFPTWRCTSCGFTFSGSEADEAKTNAICEYLGILTPREVRGIRESYGLTQRKFAQLTDIGEATLKRWESGAYLQTLAHDNFLRLISDPQCADQLKDIQQKRSNKKFGPKVAQLSEAFRHINPYDVLPKAQKFAL